MDINNHMVGSYHIGLETVMGVCWTKEGALTILIILFVLCIIAGNWYVWGDVFSRLKERRSKSAGNGCGGNGDICDRDGGDHNDNFGEDVMDDQKAKADAGKPRLTLVPRQIIWDVAEVREYGCRKYPDGGTDNWKQVEPQRFRDAMVRHMLAYLDDPYGLDEESGKPHLSHIATNVAFLCEIQKDGRKFTDE